MQKISKRAKLRYDQKFKCLKLDVGDLVLVRRKTFTGKQSQITGKMIFRELFHPRKDEIPVFIVKRIHGENKQKLHCNILFPLNQNIQGDELQLIDHVNESVETVINNKDEENGFTVLATDEQPIMQGPMTHSQTKWLMKANILMSQMFDQNFTFVPSCSDQTKTQTSSSHFRDFLYFVIGLISNR